MNSWEGGLKAWLLKKSKLSESIIWTEWALYWILRLIGGWSKVSSPSGTWKMWAFLFGSIDICLTIEEYSRILGVHCNRKLIFASLLTQDFRLRISKTLGIKKRDRRQGEQGKWMLRWVFMQFVCWSRLLWENSVSFLFLPLRFTLE